MLRVRVQPRARHDAVVGWRADGTLAVQVSAPPVEGQANGAVAAVLARALGVRVAAVRVVRGERGRDKLIRIAGLTASDIEARIGGRS